MKISIVEQVILVALAAIFQVVRTSKIITASYPPVFFVSDVVLVAVFVYALYILYDTANSVFVILQFEIEAARENEETPKK